MEHVVSKPKPVGMSKRDLEWAVASMTRQLPSNPADLAKALTDVIVTLIDKNNQAIAQALDNERNQERDD
jgi:hypothetical protein